MMYRSFIKRLLDLFLALILLPFLFILAIPVSIVIYREDKGSPFYIAHRLGRNMKKFKMVKFRTMKINAEDIRNPDGSTFNSADDPRQTRVGKWLRKTSIDELPQIINVLKGEMSFIGPRPSPLGNEGRYPKFYFKKFNVRPGVTGLTQAKLRNKATMQERMEMDVYYSEHISFLMDLGILILTLKTVLLQKNIHRNESD